MGQAFAVSYWIFGSKIVLNVVKHVLKIKLEHFFFFFFENFLSAEYQTAVLSHIGFSGTKKKKILQNCFKCHKTCFKHKTGDFFFFFKFF